VGTLCKAFRGHNSTSSSETHKSEKYWLLKKNSADINVTVATHLGRRLNGAISHCKF